MRTRSLSLLAFAFGGVVISTTWLMTHAGPLNPPAGTVSSTYKTLSDVEPRIAVSAANTPGDASNIYIISQPGSYYLTGNITGSGNKNGILISANNVTLDLRGFVLQGVGSARGIMLSAGGWTGTRVKNGTVRDWNPSFEQIALVPRSTIEDVTTIGGSSGVNATDVTAIRCNFINATTTGIIATGGLFRDCSAANCTRGFDMRRGSIVNCRAETCSTTGFYVFNGANAQGCVANACGSGFQLATGGTADSCSAQACTDAGFNLNEGCTATNCSAFSCDVGMVVLRGSIARGCTSRNSDGEGFLCNLSGNLLDSCTVTTNGLARVAPAFSVGSGDVLINCAATASTSDGFRCVDACRLTGCVATSNAGDGFHVQFGCTIKNCTARFNTGDGIETAAGGMIVENLCDSNGQGTAVAANIYATGYGARIEGNSLVSADYGIRTTGGGNVIIRNSSSSCPNHYGGIAAGNDVGPVGSAASSPSPWANIQY